MVDPAGGPSSAGRQSGPGEWHVALAPLFGTEELRVDVDGLMPTMTVSGTISRLFVGRLTWIARVTKDSSTGIWSGAISYRNGTVSLRPHTDVSVKLSGGGLPSTRKAIATFSGGPGSALTRTYTFEKAAFREVAFEYDTVSDATAVTSHNPSSHPNHAPGAPKTTLTLERAYTRLGMRVTKTGGDSIVPIGDAKSDAVWSELEMHDAMQAHWSRWTDAPQWALWVLFARLSSEGSDLGGVMFDDIGPAHRQGTSIFSDSFISLAPAGEAHPGPWVERMKFWTAVHEIGHAFNLAHSWEKPAALPWVPLPAESSALSYMNYPYAHPGGLDAFFAAFEYGFSPNELLFLRHAPARFVQPGAAFWGVNHGFERETFEQVRAACRGPLELDVRVHRQQPRYEFLEPVVAELRLKNVSATPTVVDRRVLESAGVAIVVVREDGQARRWRPYARHLTAPAPTVLQPGEAVYHSVFLSAGAGGWLIDEPGGYQVLAAADTGSGNVALSRPLRVVVQRPATREADKLADDVFTSEVAQTLAFGGTRVLHRANQTLRRVTEELPESKAAVHASAALGTPMTSEGKVLNLGADGREVVELASAAPEGARELLSCALRDLDAAADSLGHVAVTEQTKRLADVLAADGDSSVRRGLLARSAEVLTKRKVAPRVVEALRQY